MKKQKLNRLVLTMLMALVSMWANAYDFEVDGLYYTRLWWDMSTCEVGKGENYCSGDIVIPSYITNEGVTYPVTRIAGQGFGNCASLTSITLPSGLLSIGEYAFYNCTSLTSIEIPPTVTHINHDAFLECSSIKTITSYCSTPPELGDDYVFGGISKTDCVLKVPAGSVDVYKTTEIWKEFGNIIPICDDYLAIDDMCVKAGRTVDIPVVLTNKAVINSIGGRISLPEGMEIEKNAKGKCIFKLNEERASAEDAFSVSSSVQADGSVKFLLVSTDGTDISGHDGAVMYVPVVVSDDLEGDYAIRLTSVQMSDAYARLIDCPDVEATITVEQYTLGDVNNDGQIAPNDITMTIKAYLGDMPAGFVRKAADINENGVIDPADITAIIKLYLDGGASNAPMRRAARKAAASEVDSDDGVYLSAVTVEPDSECEIELSMDLKRSDYTNLGGIITLPEGFTFALNAKGKPVVRKNSDVLEYHTVSTNLLNDRQMKFFIGSNDLDLIDAGLSTLIGVKIKASATVESGDFTYTLTALQLSDYDANLYNAADAEGTITVKGAEATGIAAAGAEGSGARAYNLNGQRVDAKGARGIVIIDGKKVMRK